MATSPRPSSDRRDAVPVGPPDDTSWELAPLMAALAEARKETSEFMQRFIDQLESCQALDKSLYGERLRVAFMKRDLAAFQRRLREVQESEAATRREHERAILELRELRREHERAILGLRELHREHEQAIRELRQLRDSRVWRLGQRYWSLTRFLRRS